MTIGNTSFRDDITDVMTFEQFKKLFKGLKGATHQEAWKQLGGKIPTKKKEKDD